MCHDSERRGAARTQLAGKLQERIRRRHRRIHVRDAYAVCDMVTFPSSREGFGNPVLESVVHRKLLLVADYPVLDELREFGFQFLSLDDQAVERAVKLLEYPQLMAGNGRTGISRSAASIFPWTICGRN